MAGSGCVANECASGKEKVCRLQKNSLDERLNRAKSWQQQPKGDSFVSRSGEVATIRLASLCQRGALLRKYDTHPVKRRDL